MDVKDEPVPKDDSQCALCQDKSDEITTLPCGHKCCRGCLRDSDNSYRDQNQRCPICRKKRLVNTDQQMTPAILQGLRHKVHDLAEQCAKRKICIEEGLKDIQVQRQEVFAIVQMLDSEIQAAYEEKVNQLKRKRRGLQGRLAALHSELDELFVELQATEERTLEDVNTAMAALSPPDFKDSMEAYTLQCNEVVDLLQHAVGGNFAKGITEAAKEIQYHPASGETLDLGRL